MSTAFQILGVAASVVTAALFAMAVVTMARAVRIGGARLLVNGIAWFMPPADLPAKARGPMRRTLLCWVGAMAAMVVATVSFSLSAAFDARGAG